jgi:hypothetical protein
MPNQDLIVLIAFTFLGALGNGLLGFWDSHEPWDTRKFMGTVWRAITAAAISTSANQFLNLEGAIWLFGLLAGIAVDGVGNRLQGGVSAKTPSFSDKLDQLQDTLENIGRPPNPPIGGATP